MAKKKSEQKLEEQPRSPTEQELFQDCPKCNGEFFVRNWSEKGMNYRCDNINCRYKAFREWK